MRHLISIGILLLVMGCNGTQKRPPTIGGESLPPRDFPTSPAERDAPLGNLAVGQLGMLAGQVLQGERRVANASIRVTELDREKPRAPLLVRTDANGWFDITGLEKGQRYLLYATISRGGVTYAGQVTAIASDVRIAIPLTETQGGAGGTVGSLPGDKPAAASLGTPHRPETSPAPIVIDPTRTAQDKVRPDWDNPVRPPSVSIPAIGRDPSDNPTNRPYIPPPPGASPSDQGTTTPLPGAKEIELEPVEPPPMRYSSRTPRETPPVQVIPACVRRGNSLEELALYDRDGQPWELSKRQEGKLILLDFWRIDCPPCRAAKPQLSALQSKYGSQGFQVVSVLCENGSLAARRARLKKMEEREPLSYPVLFSEPGECPARLQLEVRRFPTLLLVDDTGRIVWSREGYDTATMNELEKLIPRMINARR